MTPILGFDVSSWQLSDFPWPAAVAWGARFCFVKAGGGYLADTGYSRHRANARAHGLATGAYWALFHHNPPAYEPTIFDPLRQARAFVSMLADDDELPAVVDVEKDGVTRALLGAFVREFERLTTRRLIVYTSRSAWYGLIGRGATEFSRLGLWQTNYSGGILEIIDIWTRPLFIQDSGTGDIPGYDKNLDLDTFNGDEAAFAVLTGKAAPVPPPVVNPVKPYPIIRSGSKIGMGSIRPGQVIPLMRQAHDRGVVWALVKSTDDGGVPIDVKAIEPRTLTLLRFVNLAEDAAQGVPGWTASQMHAHAAAALDAVWGRLSPAERAAADWIEPINEADPPGVIGWGLFGEYLKVMIDEGNARGMKLALPAFNAGTPEWAEMQNFVNTGVFGAMRAGGHILTIHEGVFGAAAVADGWPGGIPGAPVVAGAGPLCFRYRYLYSLLSARAEVVPLVISEFYAGGSYHLTPAEQVARFAWYDREARKDAYVLAVLPFTIDPDDNWRSADYTYAYPAVLDYLVAEKDIANATQGEQPMPITAAQKQSIHDALSVAAAGIAGTLAQIDAIVVDDRPAHVWQAGDVARALANPLQLFDALDGQPKGPPRPDVSYDINVLSVSVDGMWLQVSAGLWARAGDLVRKV